MSRETCSESVPRADTPERYLATQKQLPRRKEELREDVRCSEFHNSSINALVKSARVFDFVGKAETS